MRRNETDISFTVLFISVALQFAAVDWGGLLLSSDCDLELSCTASLLFTANTTE